MEKNETFRTEITDMTEDGEGIGRVDGFTVFVKDAVIGDVIEGRLMKSKKTYGYGKLTRVISPSPYRVDPPCPAAAPCGGCQLQALSYAEQLRFKERRVAGHLRRIGHFENAAVEPVIGMEGVPLRYRNKAQYPVGRAKDGRIVTGFYAGRTHTIIPVRDCLLGPEINGRITETVTSFMEEFGIEPYDELSHSGLVRHILIRNGAAAGQVLVCLVINGTRLPREKELVGRLRKTVPGLVSVCLNLNRERTNVILGKKVIPLYGPACLEDEIGGVRFRISPLSFFQVNPRQTAKLYAKVLEFAGLTGRETVWDLYCGIGAISLFLAQKAGKVYGVEVVPDAVENARENAALNGIGNAEFFTGRAEEILPEKYRESGGTMAAEVIVVDPPRKGCGRELLETMARMRPERIVYVSCDSATLARDLSFLCGSGYTLRKVQPVDMFAMCAGVETVCLLSNRKPDTKVRVDVDLKDYYRIKDSEKTSE